MKLLYVLVLLCIASAATTKAQAVSNGSGVEMTVGQDKAHADLQLSTDLISLRHCSGDNLRFFLRLNFSNKGKGAVILDKRSAVISKYMLSRNSDNATKKKYEVEVPRLVGLEAAGMSLEAVLDESQFVVLNPGELYSLDREFNLHVRAEPDNPRSPRMGHHVLQLVVLTWYYPRASNARWRDRWQSKGYLWSDPITSNAMPFTMDKRPADLDCR